MPKSLSKFCLAALALASSPAGAAPASLEAAVIDEINFARTQPQDYADMLRRYRGNFDGNVVDDPDEPGVHTTHEGVRAVDEAIAFMERQRPLPPLASGRTLALAAGDHAAAQGRRGDFGHVSAGLTPGQRVARRGGGIYVAETIAYGFATPIAIVRQLIVDDGVAGRGHRAIIFTSSLRHAGAGCGPHPMYTTMCVVDFSPTPDGRFGPPATAGRSGLPVTAGRTSAQVNTARAVNPRRDDRDEDDALDEQDERVGLR